MKKTLIALALFWLTSLAHAWSFRYPFDEIAAPSCRFSDWWSLSSDCKIQLPRIIWADYTKYKDDKTLRKVYSILWWSTYNYWWDVWYWSHLWLDIATSAWTPVKSIWDWEVITAWWLSWWWNTVSIKHKLSDWRYVYSNYSHMSKVITKKWLVKAWDIIWEVWATWNAYWNHLHFQIDITNQSHPYWYSTCSKWVDIMDVVNDWMCRDYLLTNTIDPILFLESNWSFSDVTVSVIQQKQEKTVKIQQKNIKSRQQILDEEIQDFLKTHKIDLETWVTSDNLQVWKTYLTKLVVTKNWKPFTWSMPGAWVEFIYDTTKAKVFPASVIYVEKWTREIKITWTKSWSIWITLKIWNVVITTKQVNFFTPSEMMNPTDANIIMSWNKTGLWEEKQWAVIFKTKFWSNQISIPYGWEYILRASTWKAKFCNISKNKLKSCNTHELVSELYFKYDDTNNWILFFTTIAFDYAPIKLSLTKKWSKNDIAWTKSQLLVSDPLSLLSNYPYYNEDINSLKKWYLRLTWWYLLQDRDITWRQLKDMITNYLWYEFLRSGDNIQKKNLIISKIWYFKKITASISDTEKIGRWKFAKMLMDILDIKITKNSNSILMDEKWEYKDYITSLREVYSFKWKDQFWASYFQPEKPITIWEALYLIEKIW